MKKYDYYRSAGRPVAKRPKIRKKLSFSFLKPIFLLCVVLTLCVGTYWAAKRAYEGWTASRLGTWKPKAVVVSGADNVLTKEIQTLAQSYIEQPFAISDAVALQKQLSQKYPQLREIHVKRGLFSGQLNIRLKHRVALAKIDNTEQGVRFIDEDGTLYIDPGLDPLRSILSVEIDGEIPRKLAQPWTRFIEQHLKSKQKLEVKKLVLHLDSQTVEMYLSDGSVIYFGTLIDAREKLRRAAQIVAHQAHVHATGAVKPYSLDFTYFENGKVFLRQKAR